MKHLILVMLSMVLTTLSYAEEVKKVEPQAVAAEAAKVDPVPEAPKVEEHKVPLPPSWLDEVMAVAFKIPVVGPFLLTIMQWLGLIASVLTVLVTLILGGLQSLAVVLKWAKLADLAVKVLAFQNSPIMYWLKFFSLYNAKK